MLERRRAVIAALAAIAAPAPAIPAHAADVPPDEQASLMTLTYSRSHDLTPELLQQAGEVAVQRAQDRARLLASDPERRPDPNFCSLSTCVGDPRLEHFTGTVEPVLFTARNGATLSGHVWATRPGPGVVILNGSILAPEQYHWFAAQSLARAGYVVLSFDLQGEGISDQLGEPPDQLESLAAGAPPIGDGGPFYDGGTDAIDFLLSSPRRPYVPRPSRTSGTSHAAKQERRVAAGLNPPYNPLHRLLDRRAGIGLAGHSYGAIGASYLAQYDDRVGAVVAWDSLCLPHNAGQTELEALGSPGPTVLGIPFPTAASSIGPECWGAPPGYPATIPLRTPALGISGDYVLPRPFAEAPDRGVKAAVPDAYAAAGVDSGNIVIRGGNHADFSFLPAPLGTLRGIDLTTWYTVAWFDKYLRHAPTADARLLSDRWRADADTARVDPRGDPNAFSKLYDSRLDFHTDLGRHVRCISLRDCPQVRASPDCGPDTFGYLAVAAGRIPVRVRCRAARPRCVVRVRLPKRVRRVRATADGRRVRVSRGGRLRVHRVGTRLRLTVRFKGGRTRTLHRTVARCG